MADTKIEWTERSWNPVVGCSLESPGCTNCYAMPMAYRLAAMASRADGTGNPALDHYVSLTEQSRKGKPVWTGKLAFNEKALLEPLRRKTPTMYFVNSMGDLFHEDCPDEWIDRVFAVMALCPQHTFQVLTKRSRRMREYCSDPGTPERIAQVILDEAESWSVRGQAVLAPLGDREREEDPSFVRWPLPNVWKGTSVEDQKRADERIPDLLDTPATVRWLSCEPLLGAVDLSTPWLTDKCCGTYPFPNMPLEMRTTRLHLLDWVVCGGESGPGARPMHPDWARSLRDQCAVAGVPFFFKQWGEHLLAQERHLHGFPPGDFVDHLDAGKGFIKVGKKRAGRLLDGVTHDAMPQVPA